jgi:hypothetical protein
MSATPTAAMLRPSLLIDPEFQNLIPALLPEEFAQLEANILRDGCKDPLLYWAEVPGKHVLEWRLRSAQETKNKAPELHARVIAGRLTPGEARQLSTLPSEARKSALATVDTGATAASVIREAKKKEARKVVSIFVELSNKLNLLAPSYSDGEEHVFVRLMEDVCRAPKDDLSPTDNAHLQSIVYLLARIEQEFVGYRERLTKGTQNA